MKNFSEYFNNLGDKESKEIRLTEGKYDYVKHTFSNVKEIDKKDKEIAEENIKVTENLFKMMTNYDFDIINKQLRFTELSLSDFIGAYNSKDSVEARPNLKKIADFYNDKGLKDLEHHLIEISFAANQLSKRCKEIREILKKNGLKI